MAARLAWNCFTRFHGMRFLAIRIFFYKFTDSAAMLVYWKIEKREDFLRRAGRIDGYLQ